MADCFSKEGALQKKGATILSWIRDLDDFLRNWDTYTELNRGGEKRIV